MRPTAINAMYKIATPFEPGGAFDSQTGSQEYVKELYNAAGVSVHVPEHSKQPPKQKSRDVRVNEEPEAEELEDLRAELEKTKAELEETKAELEKSKTELEETKRDLHRAQRNAEQWHNAATKAAAAVERVAKQVAVANQVTAAGEALNVIEVAED
ncbi:hypothetical protein DFH08DRAFT_943509 [Mycena albidolilacea]|uniref:Uncharacterized protein n=1 Tax=Mycena albidolilacea TaxID=1033008 RepID=A0AAD6Z9C0_9AGAR|nr:hypothetical protein DFH08DRAFT_943509 [Mycena albidolilacea]